MNKANHTPGPWVIDENPPPFDGDIHGTIVVAAGEPLRAMAIVARGGGPYDARLIAAAPDLLAALEKAVMRQGFSNEELISARAVIAKAKGRAP